MEIGLLSQFPTQDTIKSFTEAADRKGINLRHLYPSQIIIRVHNNRIYLYDPNMNSLHVDGVVNWEPYPVSLEFEKACCCLGIPFINNTEAVRTARNKMLTSLALSIQKLPQSDTLYINKNVKHISCYFDLPAVFKPITGTMGEGAYKIHSLQDLSLTMDKKLGKQDIYLQRFIANSGWDLRVVVVDNKVLGAIKKTASPGEWRTHTVHGGRAESFQLDRKLEELSLKAAQALNLNFAGVDIMVEQSTGSYQILEVNAVPGLKLFEETTGTSIAQPILELMINKAQD